MGHLPDEAVSHSYHFPETPLLMSDPTSGPSVTRLVRLRKGPLGAAFAVIFAAALALPLAYAVLLLWSLGRPDRLADPAAWGVLTGAYLGWLGMALIVQFVLYPDLELYTHGIVIRVPGRRFILPWDAVHAARQTRGPLVIVLDAPLTPFHHLLGGLLLTRRPVILIAARQRRAAQVRAVLREYLPEGRYR